MRSALFLIIVGLGGAAILIGLGTWQVQRLAWKQGVIADIEARIVAEPVALPDDLDPENDAYLPIKTQGFIGPEHLRVLVSQKQEGAGYRIISPLWFGNNGDPEGAIMVDRGFIPADVRGIVLYQGGTLKEVIGNLQWPQETDSFTPEPDEAKNIWYARDVERMAKALGTRPVLLVAREIYLPHGKITPMPVDTSRIPNNHLQYAITWFSLAFIWLAMSLYFVRRRRA